MIGKGSGRRSAPPKPRQRPPREGGARRAGPSLATRLQGYFISHLQTLFYALGQLSRHPFSTLMTSAVIGIALAMPTALQLVLGNMQAVVGGWEGTAQISLFLEKGVGEKAAQQLASELRRRDAIESVSYISREQALEEFRALSGFGEALQALEENPLPSVLVLRPQLAHSGPEQLNALVTELEKMAEVETAQLDMAWIRRLYALMDIGRHVVWVLSALLALAVLLVVGNTIRLSIQNRRDEIVITKLIGGTDSFIRRPFLYRGLWYGLFGGLITVVLIGASFSFLRTPVQALTALYHSSFRLAGLALGDTLLVLLAAALLGLVGSWLAVGRHLRDIEPR